MFSEDSMKRIACTVLVLVTLWLRPDQEPIYIYPVGSFEYAGNRHILVLKQWATETLELYDWNSTTSRMSKMLMSTYTPACVMMLPDLSGFSFVDNGRIRIKRFVKWAVKTLDIYEPIYGIEFIRWLDEQTCYFHAKCDGHYGIYTINMEEELVALYAGSSVDYLFPFMVGASCFCIEKSGTHSLCNYKIIRCSQGRAPEVIATFGSQQLALLEMQSEHEGYVLGYEIKGPMVHFHWYQLMYEENAWRLNIVLDFNVPEYLLYGPRRLYESILPFVPRIIGSCIYYSSYDSITQKMALYKFNRKKDTLETKMHTDKHLFAPIFDHKKGWCGGTMFPCDLTNL